jgi:cysteine desulfurase
MARLVRKAPRGVTQPIYLDYQATTPLAPEAAEAMRPWLEENFGNPHSAHRMGREAAAAIEVARSHVQAAIGDEAGRGRLHFTSGATEAANWALKGAVTRFASGRNRIVTIATEHACVLDSVGWLQGQGLDVVILPVRADGLVDLDLLAAQITDTTGLVAAMLVNNEIGVIQPIAEIGRIAHERGALFFCDAVQGLGRVHIPDECDMIAVSAHKIHGPKGIGALWLRNDIRIDPLLHGGGQEGGIRSGTLSPFLCAGFGAAAQLMSEKRDEDSAHVEALWQLAQPLLQTGWTLNGSAERRYHGNLNIRRADLDSARLISDLRMVALSAGSACASGSGRPSHILSALGLDDKEARSSIRLGFGRYTGMDEMKLALTMIEEATERQRVFAA